MAKSQSKQRTTAGTGGCQQGRPKANSNKCKTECALDQMELEASAEECVGDSCVPHKVEVKMQAKD